MLGRDLARTRILDLAERFSCAAGWGLERTFTNWAYKQPFRACLPKPFVSPTQSSLNILFGGLVQGFYWLLWVAAGWKSRRLLEFIGFRPNDMMYGDFSANLRWMLFQEVIHM